MSNFFNKKRDIDKELVRLTTEKSKLLPVFKSEANGLDGIKMSFGESLSGRDSFILYRGGIYPSDGPGTQWIEISIDNMCILRDWLNKNLGD